VHLFDELRRRVRLAGDGDKFEQVIYGSRNLTVKYICNTETNNMAM